MRAVISAEMSSGLTGAGAYCNNPLVFDYRGEPTVVWFDNRRGQNRVYIAQRAGVLWQDTDLSASRVDASFARPAVGAGRFVRFLAIEPARRRPTDVS